MANSPWINDFAGSESRGETNPFMQDTSGRDQIPVWRDDSPYNDPRYFSTGKNLYQQESAIKNNPEYRNFMARTAYRLGIDIEQTTGLLHDLYGDQAFHEQTAQGPVWRFGESKVGGQKMADRTFAEIESAAETKWGRSYSTTSYEGETQMAEPLWNYRHTTPARQALLKKGVGRQVTREEPITPEETYLGSVAVPNTELGYIPGYAVQGENIEIGSDPNKASKRSKTAISRNLLFSSNLPKARAAVAPQRGESPITNKMDSIIFMSRGILPAGQGFSNPNVIGSGVDPRKRLTVTLPPEFAEAYRAGEWTPNLTVGQKEQLDDRSRLQVAPGVTKKISSAQAFTPHTWGIHKNRLVIQGEAEYGGNLGAKLYGSKSGLANSPQMGRWDIRDRDGPIEGVGLIAEANEYSHQAYGITTHWSPERVRRVLGEDRWYPGASEKVWRDVLAKNEIRTISMTTPRYIGAEGGEIEPQLKALIKSGVVDKDTGIKNVRTRDGSRFADVTVTAPAYVGPTGQRVKKNWIYGSRRVSGRELESLQQVNPGRAGAVKRYSKRHQRVIGDYMGAAAASQGNNPGYQAIKGEDVLSRLDAFQMRADTLREKESPYSFPGSEEFGKDRYLMDVLSKETSGRGITFDLSDYGLKGGRLVMPSPRTVTSLLGGGDVEDQDFGALRYYPRILKQLNEIKGGETDADMQARAQSNIDYFREKFYENTSSPAMRRAYYGFRSPGLGGQIQGSASLAPAEAFISKDRLSGMIGEIWGNKEYGGFRLSETFDNPEAAAEAMLRGEYQMIRDPTVVRYPVNETWQTDVHVRPLTYEQARSRFGDLSEDELNALGVRISPVMAQALSGDLDIDPFAMRAGTSPKRGDLAKMNAFVQRGARVGVAGELQDLIEKAGEVPGSPQAAVARAIENIQTTSLGNLARQSQLFEENKAMMGPTFNAFMRTAQTMMTRDSHDLPELQQKRLRQMARLVGDTIGSPLYMETQDAKGLTASAGKILSHLTYNASTRGYFNKMADKGGRLNVVNATIDDWLKLGEEMPNVPKPVIASMLMKPTGERFGELTQLVGQGKSANEDILDLLYEEAEGDRFNLINNSPWMSAAATAGFARGVRGTERHPRTEEESAAYYASLGPQKKRWADIGKAQRDYLRMMSRTRGGRKYTASEFLENVVASKDTGIMSPQRAKNIMGPTRWSGLVPGPGLPDDAEFEVHSIRELSSGGASGGGTPPSPPPSAPPSGGSPPGDDDDGDDQDETVENAPVDAEAIRNERAAAARKNLRQAAGGSGRVVEDMVSGTTDTYEGPANVRAVQLVEEMEKFYASNKILTRNTRTFPGLGTSSRAEEVSYLPSEADIELAESRWRKIMKKGGSVEQVQRIMKDVMAGNVLQDPKDRELLTPILQYTTSMRGLHNSLFQGESTEQFYNRSFQQLINDESLSDEDRDILVAGAEEAQRQGPGKEARDKIERRINTMSGRLDLERKHGIFKEAQARLRTMKNDVQGMPSVADAEKEQGQEAFAKMASGLVRGGVSYGDPLSVASVARGEGIERQSDLNLLYKLASGQPLTDSQQIRLTGTGLTSKEIGEYDQRTRGKPRDLSAEDTRALIRDLVKGGSYYENPLEAVEDLVDLGDPSSSQMSDVHRVASGKLTDRLKNKLMAEYDLTSKQIGEYEQSMLPDQGALEKQLQEATSDLTAARKLAASEHTETAKIERDSKRAALRRTVRSGIEAAEAGGFGPEYRQSEAFQAASRELTMAEGTVVDRGFKFARGALSPFSPHRMIMNRAWKSLGAPTFQQYIPAAAQGQTRASQVAGTMGYGVAFDGSSRTLRTLQAQRNANRVAAGRAGFQAWGGFMGMDSGGLGATAQMAQSVFGPAIGLGVGAGMLSHLAGSAFPALTGFGIAAPAIGVGVGLGAATIAGGQYRQSIMQPTPANYAQAYEDQRNGGWGAMFREVMRTPKMLQGGYSTLPGALFNLGRSAIRASQGNIPMADEGRAQAETPLSELPLPARTAQIQSYARRLREDYVGFGQYEEGDIQAMIGQFATYGAADQLTNDNLGFMSRNMRVAMATGIGPAQFQGIRRAYGMGPGAEASLHGRLVRDYGITSASGIMGVMEGMQQLSPLAQYGLTAPSAMALVQQSGGPMNAEQMRDFNKLMSGNQQFISGAVMGDTGALPGWLAPAIEGNYGLQTRNAITGEALGTRSGRDLIRAFVGRGKAGTEQLREMGFEGFKTDAAKEGGLVGLRDWYKNEQRTFADRAYAIKVRQFENQYGAMGEPLGGFAAAQLGNQYSQLQLSRATALGGTFRGQEYTGRFNFQRRQMAMNYKYQSAQMDIQAAQMAENFGYQNYQSAYQRQSMQIGRQRQLIQRGWQMEDLNRQGGQIEWRQNYQLDMMGLNRQASLLQRGFTREGMAIQQARSQREFGWQMEDFDEGIRFARGRERERLITQRERAVIRQNDQTSDFDRQKEQQEQLWKIEDERYEKQLENLKRNQKIEDETFERQRERILQQQEWEDEDFERETEHFERGVEHQKRLQKLQQANFNLREQKMEESHELQVEQLEENEKATVQNLELQEESLGIQAAKLKEQKKIQEDLLDLEKERKDTNEDYKDDITTLNELMRTLSTTIMPQIETTFSAVVDEAEHLIWLNERFGWPLLREDPRGFGK